jgi:hypothetical protein
MNDMNSNTCRKENTMNLFEQLQYSYKGFREGEYIHNFFLPECYQESISPRDILAIFWKLRGFTPDLSIFKIVPSTLRVSGALKAAEIVSDVLRGNDLVIHYSKESLHKEIPAELASAAIEACMSYTRAAADTSLGEDEIAFLITLNERIKQEQRNAMERAASMGQRLLELGESVNININFDFQMHDDHPENKHPGLTCLFVSTHDSIAGSTQSELETDVEKLRQYYESDCNKKKHIDTPLYQVEHGPIFMQLEDRSPLPLKHLCRIGKIETNIEIRFSSQSILE